MLLPCSSTSFQSATLHDFLATLDLPKATNHYAYHYIPREMSIAHAHAMDLSEKNLKVLKSGNALYFWPTTLHFLLLHRA